VASLCSLAHGFVRGTFLAAQTFSRCVRRARRIWPAAITEVLGIIFLKWVRFPDMRDLVLVFV
jgi:peptidoglycan/LPS O-acetylase OafA/YrhL